MSLHRHRLATTPAPAAAKDTAADISLLDDLDAAQLPSDTEAAIEYLVAQMDPRRIKDRRVFPKVCMVHQIYGIVKDHTTVDRTLDQLIKNGTIRKFFLGGTGSDEFAIMFTTDYIQQIEDAKAQYLKDLADPGDPGSKRKALSDPAANINPRTKMLKGGKAGSPGSSSHRHAEPLHAAAAATTGSPSSYNRDDTVFDRFKKLVSGGNHFEVMIQHQTLQHVMDATDTEITLMIRYGLLNRMLTVPANPHLVNMTKTATRGTGAGTGPGGVGNSTAASEAEAASLRAAHQTIATLRAGRSLSASTMGGLSPSTTAGADSTAKLGSGGRASPSSASSSAASSHLSKEGISVEAAGSRGEQVSDEILYRFAIRQGGLFVSHFLKGRQEMLRTIKRKPFGDMLVSAIKAKTLRGSSLTHDFHIQDLVGSGRVRSVDTTSGQLLKITQKGEASARAGC